MVVAEMNTKSIKGGELSATVGASGFGISGEREFRDEAALDVVGGTDEGRFSGIGGVEVATCKGDRAVEGVGPEGETWPAIAMKAKTRHGRRIHGGGIHGRGIDFLPEPGHLVV
jgi:hypothetical protein